MIIALGADHRGFEHKEHIKNKLFVPGQTITWLDVGAHSKERSDYPIFVKSVCTAMQQKKASMGILLCGSGVGMSIAANRFKDIYAALVWNEEVARMCKEDDNANVLVIPADFVSFDVTIAMILSWYEAKFKEGRYRERVAMIDGITQK